MGKIWTFPPPTNSWLLYGAHLILLEVPELVQYLNDRKKSELLTCPVPFFLSSIYLNPHPTSLVWWWGQKSRQ